MAKEHKTANLERRGFIKETFAAAAFIFQRLRIMLDKVKAYNMNCWASNDQALLSESVESSVRKYEQRIEEYSRLL